MEFSLGAVSADGRAMVRVRRVVKAMMRIEKCILAFEGQVLIVGACYKLLVVLQLRWSLEKFTYLDLETKNWLRMRS